MCYQKTIDIWSTIITLLGLLWPAAGSRQLMLSREPRPAARPSSPPVSFPSSGCFLCCALEAAAPLFKVHHFLHVQPISASFLIHHLPRTRARTGLSGRRLEDEPQHALLPPVAFTLPLTHSCI